MSRTPCYAIAAFALACPALDALAAPGRTEVSLNGAWQSVVAQDHQAPPRDAEWQPVRVPGSFRSVRGEKRWLRRTFNLPAEWSGRRIYIVYDGVKYNSVHFVNGQRVGEHFRGYDRFEIDLTPAAKFGEDNELLVGCSDWQSTFEKPVDLTDKPGGHAARAYPRAVGLTPLGGQSYEYGIWADVKLVAVSPVHVSDVTIRTSVRKWSLDLQVEVRNAGKVSADATVDGCVFDAAGVALPAKQVRLRPGERKSVRWQAPWQCPHPWSIEDPTLYLLDARVAVAGQTVDTQRTRFGFREFWCEGSYFYLNGTRLLLRSSSMWPLAEPDKEAAKGRLRKLQAINVICFRTHTQPWRQYWYDAADEVGMLMIPEGPVFNDDNIYKLDGQRFWDNYAAELRSMTQRFKNSPSVVMFSLENEFYGTHMNDKAPSKPQLVRLGELMRQWDPTRPFMYESDGDPGEVADVIGIHYPHEMGPQYLYPNTCYWMDTPKKPTHWFTNGAEMWKWERNKPLYIGEYLWCPCTTPKKYTTFFGDAAYRDYGRYHNAAIGEAWSMQTRVYRYYRVSGLCPWTIAGTDLDPAQHPMVAAQAESMRPLAAFVKEYTSRFYEGSTIQRTLHVMNDTLHAGRVKVSWEFLAQGRPAQHGEIALDMQPADVRAESFEIKMPRVDKPTDATLTVRASMPKAPAFEDVMRYQVYPRPKLSQPRAKVGVFGPQALKALASAGVEATEIHDLRNVPTDVRLLVVGADALAAPERTEVKVLRVAPQAAANQPLRQYVEAGGRVLLMAQTKPHAPLAGIEFTPRQATLVFPLARLHPVLDGIRDEDLKFWSPDHIVADAQVLRTGCAGKAILVSGSDAGIAFSPLAECQRGKGVVMACGLRLLEALDREPAAAALLSNLLKHLDKWAPETRDCVVVPAGTDFAKRLARMDLGFIPGANAAVSPERTQLVACAGDPGADVLDRLVSGFVPQGGTLWWHRPEPAAFTRVMKQLGHECSLVPVSSPVMLHWDDPFVDGLAQADIYWPGEKAKGAPGWARVSLDPAIIDCEVGLVRRVDVDKAKAYPCMDMKVTGSKWNRPVGEGFIVLASRGSVIDEIDLGRGGTVLMGCRAKGSPAGGVWPRLAVSVDGHNVGFVSVTSKLAATYGVAAEVPAGKHRVEFEFINDHQVDAEDRNVYLSHVYVQPAQSLPEGVTMHASPGALASIRVGKGTIVVDTIKWDDPGPHANRAAAFAKSLMIKLGARPRGSALASLEAEKMDFEEVAHNARRPTELILANPGSVWADIVADAAGEYDLRIYARGQIALDEWPVLVVKLDGQQIGQITLDSPSHVPFDLPIKLTAGAHRLEMRFINDVYKAGVYDRNCCLDKVEIWPKRVGAGWPG